MTNSRPTMSTCHLYFLPEHYASKATLWISPLFIYSSSSSSSHPWTENSFYPPSESFSGTRWEKLVGSLVNCVGWLIESVFRDYLIYMFIYISLRYNLYDLTFYGFSILSQFNVSSFSIFECLIVNIITVGYCFICLFILFNPIDGVIPLIACTQLVLLINYAWCETRMVVKIRSELRVSSFN